MRLSRVWLDGLSLMVGIVMLICAAFSLAEMRRDELLIPLMVAGFFVLLACLDFWMSVQLGDFQRRRHELKKRKKETDGHRDHGPEEGQEAV